MTTDNQEQFAGRLVGILNDGGLALLIGIGHQTGLFDAMAGAPPQTSSRIAEAAGLVERYVREWLGGMVAGGVVEHDAANETFHLPPERAASLVRAAGAGNLAALMEYLPALAEVEPGVVHAFRHGGGVPGASYGRLQRVMAEDSARTFGASLLEQTLPMVGGLVERLGAGGTVLDVGCGRGAAVHIMAAAFARSSFLGIDVSREAIEAARSEAARRGLANARFEVIDAATLAASEAYDLVTAFDAIHDLARPLTVVRAIHRALRAEGTFLMVDIAASSRMADNREHPLAPFLYAASTLHCVSVSLAAGGEGLGAMWGEARARELLAAAGFGGVEVRRVDGDLLNSYYLARRTSAA